MTSRAEKILAKLSRMPEFKKAEAEEAQANVTEREASVTKIKELREALEKDIVPVRKLVEKNLGLFEKAREALKVAEMKLRHAQLDEHNLRTRAETQIYQLEQRLRDSAHPDLRAFIQMTIELWDKERGTWLWSAPVDKDGERMLGRVRMEQIRDVTRRAEEIQYLPDPVEAEAALQALKVEIETPQEVAAVA